MEITGKKIIITGGGSGIGRCLVDVLLEKGGHVTVFDIDENALKKLKDEQDDVVCIPCDITDYQQVVSTVDHYYQQFEAPDILVNNAGILYSAPLLRIGPAGIEKHDPAEWGRVLAVNLDAVFYMTSCAAEKMIMTRTRGVIVNISSVSASGNTGQSAYSAAKAGVNALTSTWAKELGLMGIRVVAVAPGFIETDSTHKALSENLLKETIQKAPLRRLGKPQEVAQAVISVIENDFFNGKVLALDGGLFL